MCAAEKQLRGFTIYIRSGFFTVMINILTSGFNFLRKKMASLSGCQDIKGYCNIF